MKKHYSKVNEQRVWIRSSDSISAIPYLVAARIMPLASQGIAIANNPGIYLWTVQADFGDSVNYVGETGRLFSARMFERLTRRLSCVYHIYEPDSFRHGAKRVLWKGDVTCLPRHASTNS